MTKAYISVSFNNRKFVDKELRIICDTLTQFNIVPFLFVDNYCFDPTLERQMMQQAMCDIGNCDLLIAETSSKGIGIGIEAGYAKAKGKPVIYIRHRDAEHSTTVSGISDFQIIYHDNEHLKHQLTEILPQILCRNGSSGY